MLLDFNKAFDRVSHEYLAQILPSIKLSPKILQALRAITEQQEAQVYINKCYGTSFPLKSGVRQGNPASPLLFILALEPFLIKIQANLLGFKFSIHFIQGITLKYSAYADDVLIYLKDSTDVERLKKELKVFCSYSGSKVNFDKSIIYSFKQELKEPRIANFPVKAYLDTEFTYLGVSSKTIDWTRQIEKLRRGLFLNLIQGVPTLDRVQGINTYLFPKLYFRDLHTPMTDKHIQEMIRKAKTLLPKGIGEANLFKIPEKGGYGLLDLQIQLQGRRASYI